MLNREIGVITQWKLHKVNTIGLYNAKKIKLSYPVTCHEGAWRREGIAPTHS
jgi:hypothetical protein